MTKKEIWQELHDVFGFTPKLDGVVSGIANDICIDVIALDEEFNRRDPDYKSSDCTYKGKKDYSMSNYIEEKYGKDISDKVRLLL